MGDVIGISDKLRNAAGALVRYDSSAEVVPLDTLITAYVRAAVHMCGGNKSLAARKLGLSRRTLYRWLDREAA